MNYMINCVVCFMDGKEAKGKQSTQYVLEEGFQHRRCCWARPWKINIKLINCLLINFTVEWLGKNHLVLVSQLCLTLWDPMYCSPSGSSVHGILQARILEPVAISYSRGSFQLRDQNPLSCSSWFAGRFFTTEPPRKPNEDPILQIPGICVLITDCCFWSLKCRQRNRWWPPLLHFLPLLQTPPSSPSSNDCQEI